MTLLLSLSFIHQVAHACIPIWELNALKLIKQTRLGNTRKCAWNLKLHQKIGWLIMQEDLHRGLGIVSILRKTPTFEFVDLVFDQVPTFWFICRCWHELTYSYPGLWHYCTRT